MSANDDDLGDDDQLKQLRSVWVSMRESDEEPPDHGLDALMAAARTKAADMAPPASEGFWTKFLAVFRRPPVLALASITVLLGGALFIAQRRDSMQSTETAAARQEQSGSSAPAPSPAADPPPPVEIATGGAGAVVAAPQATPIEPPRVPERSRTPVAKRPVSVKSEKLQWKGGKSDEGGEDAVAPPPSTTTVVTESEAPGSAPVVAPADPVAGTTRGPTLKPPAKKPADAFGRGEAKLGLDEDVAAPTIDRRAQDMQVIQLVKQCESAAARNDCPAVRVLAEKIKSADAAAYKQRVAGNSAIARCLE